MMDIDPEPAATSTPTTSSPVILPQSDPNDFLVRLNDSKPVCPVLMNTLHFPLRLPAQRYALARLQTLRAAGQDSGFMACQHQHQQPGSSSSSFPPGLQQPLTQVLMADG